MKNINFILLIVLINFSIYNKVLSYTTKFLNTNYTLDFIKNSAQVIKCTPNTECPHYSGGCHVMDVDIHSNTYGSGYCNLSFICRQDKNCVVELKEEILFSDNNHKYLTTQTYDLREGFTEIKNDLFVSSCQVEDINNLLTSIDDNNCKTNDNCYSDTCQNGICVSNTANPTYQCNLIYHDTKKEPVIECVTIDQYKCENGKKCSSNYCNNFKRNDMITAQEIDGVSKNNLYMTLAFSILLIFPLFFFF
ncbi:hypothetical protein U3516DRAFT_890173 [Neocallimastix sp. 'constans']|jgi:hypothetical protein